MEKKNLQKHIERAASILAYVARKQRAALPSVKEAAAVMQQELANVSRLDQVFRKRAQSVLAAIRHQRNR